MNVPPESVLMPPLRRTLSTRFPAVYDNGNQRWQPAWSEAECGLLNAAGFPDCAIRATARRSSMRRQIGVQRGDHLRAFADRGADALDRIEPDVADREDARPARLEQLCVLAGIGAGRDEAFWTGRDA